MKKLSNLHKKVLNIAVTFLFIFALISVNVVKVAAYTADTSITGYPFILTNMKAYYYDGSIGVYSDGVLQEQNSYYFPFYDLSSDLSSGFYELRFGNNTESMIFPYEPELYDYYCVGTYAYDGNYEYDYSFKPTTFRTIFVEDDILNAYHSDLELYPFETTDLHGYSFSSKLNMNGQSALSCISFIDGNKGTIGKELYFSCSIIPVAKSGTEADTLNSILQILNQINQNIITGNTLQQQTIDAINQNTTNTTNWFTTLISNLSTWYYQRKEDLSNWFLDIDNRLSSGFAALYSQMTREQDEKLNGYDDTTQSDAAASFSSESDKLTSLEGELSTQGNDFVNDYTSDGFDTGVLTTLGSSLVFVATWFTNFWNMGGVFTATLNLCFALSIVFFIFRIKR